MIHSKNIKPIDDDPYVEDGLKKSKNSIKIVDLFAGIGGFHYGIAAAAKKKRLAVEPLLVAEINKDCRDVYMANHNCTAEIFQTDVKKLDLSTRDQADILTAGFPCQPFSNSGRKRGISDPRGKYYDAIVEAITAFDTKTFILENVPGMRTNGSKAGMSRYAFTEKLIGNSMKRMEERFDELEKRYHIKWLEINSSDVGSPQVRKRLYFIGVHRDLKVEPVLGESFVIQQYKKNAFMKIAERKKSDRDLDFSEMQIKNIRRTLNRANPPSFKDGMRRVGKAYSCPGGNVGQAYHAYGMVPTLTKVWARFLPIYFPHPDEAKPSLKSREFVPDRFYGKGFLRRASVVEAMRLQGFPNSFVPHESDRIAYEQAGNAVNAKVIREIADNLLRYIV